MYIQLKLIADLHVSKDNFDQSKIMFMRISKFKCITIYNYILLGQVSNFIKKKHEKKNSLLTFGIFFR